MNDTRRRRRLSFAAGVLATLVLAGSAHAAVTNFYWTDRDAATLNKTTAGDGASDGIAGVGGRRPPPAPSRRSTIASRVDAGARSAGFLEKGV